MKEPEINLNGWVTIKELAKRLNTNTQFITTWIGREKIPCRQYPELNGIRLVPGDWKPNS